MKNIAASIFLATATAAAPVLAGPPHGHSHRHGDIIAPIVLGTIIGYGVSQAQRRDDAPVVIHNPPPVVIHNPPPIYVQQQPRIIPLARAADPVYDKRIQYDSSCNCQVEVWVQIGWR